MFTTLRPAGVSTVVVAVDGSDTDRPTLAWAAEEASDAHWPLVIAHAAGHLPPDMTYAARHAARQERRDEGRRSVDREAEWVRALAPGLCVRTEVRLLELAALLPALSNDAHTLVQAGEPWARRERLGLRAPVIAALTDSVADAHVLDHATDYAARRNLDLLVFEGHDVARQLRALTRPSSLVLLARPDGTRISPVVSWPVTLDLVACSHSPVVLLSGTGRTATRTLVRRRRIL